MDTDNKCSGGILQHGRISTLLHLNCWPVWLQSQGFFTSRREKLEWLHVRSSFLGSRHLLICHDRLNNHFAESLFYLSSVKSCYWKKWQWNSGKDNRNPWGKGKKLDHTGWLRKECQLAETWPFTLRPLTIDLTILPQERIQSHFLSPASSLLARPLFLRQ